MNLTDEQKIDKMVDEYHSILCRISGLYQKLALKQNITSFRLNILQALYFEEDVTQKDICNHYVIPKQTVCKDIKELERQQYICLKQSLKDKREKIIILTDKGKDYAAKQLFPFIDTDRRIIKRIGMKRFEQFVEMLNNFADAAEVETNI